MSARTVEVEIDHGQIKACDGSALPEHARGVLSIVESAAVRDPFRVDPTLKVTFLEDPTLPLDPEGWPDSEW